MRPASTARRRSPPRDARHPGRAGSVDGPVHRAASRPARAHSSGRPHQARPAPRSRRGPRRPRGSRAARASVGAHGAGHPSRGCRRGVARPRAPSESCPTGSSDPSGRRLRAGAPRPRRAARPAGHLARHPRPASTLLSGARSPAHRRSSTFLLGRAPASHARVTHGPYLRGTRRRSRDGVHGPAPRGARERVIIGPSTRPGPGDRRSHMDGMTEPPPAGGSAPRRLADAGSADDRARDASRGLDRHRRPTTGAASARLG